MNVLLCLIGRFNFVTDLCIRKTSHIGLGPTVVLDSKIWADQKGKSVGFEIERNYLCTSSSKYCESAGRCSLNHNFGPVAAGNMSISKA